jgi:N-acetylglucosaminyl-diphospho-decaprenol L-rhamnosyltransferase
MVDYLDRRPDVGCATCRVELEDGSLDLACRRLFPTPERSLYRMTLLSKVFPRSRRFGQYNLTYLDDRQETEIDQPCGAFMMVRSEIREQVGLLDERYFMYTEDVDFCAAIRARGRKILFTPNVEIVHLRGRSAASAPGQTRRAYRQSQLAFYEKHHPGWAPVLRLYLRLRGEL